MVTKGVFHLVAVVVMVGGFFQVAILGPIVLVEVFELGFLKGVLDVMGGFLVDATATPAMGRAAGVGFIGGIS